MVAAGAGGNQAAGGAMGAGGAVGTGGSGGTAGSAAVLDGGGAGGAKDGGVDAGKPSCATLPLCDDFENVPPESRPDSTKWMVDPTTPPNGLLVDGQRFPGQKTVRIEGVSSLQTAALFKNATALNIGKVWFVRMRVAVPKPFSMGTGGLMAILDEVSGSRVWLTIDNGYLAYFIQRGATIGSRVLPSADANQVATGYKVPDTWMCIEVKFDANNSQIQTWVNGVDIRALDADGVATGGVDDVWMNMAQPFKPSALTTIVFGWRGFVGPQVELWMDDVAVAATRIGCN